MTEAEITCECLSIRIPDLQLALTRGMVVYLDAQVAKKSSDLTRAIYAHGVSVKYVQRFRERRPPPVEPHVESRVQPPVVPDLPRTLPSEPSVDAETIAQRVVELLAPRLEALLSSRVGGGSAPISLPSSSPAPGKVPLVDDSVPLFIPSRIGRDDLQPVVIVAEGGEADGVSDALAALKAARKEKKR